MARLVLGLATLLCATAPVLAEPSTPSEEAQTERARVHLKAAIAYYDEARYEDAAREMETAYGIKPLPDLQYNLAQCYERQGRYEQAAHAYEIYLGGNPGAADRRLVTTRIVNLRERAQAVAAGIQAPPAAQEKVVFKTIVIYRQAPPPPGRGVRYAAYGAGVLALAGLGSGIAFSILARQAADTVTRGGSTTAPPVFDGSARVAQSTGHTDVIVAGVSFGVAGLCAAGAIGLYALGHKIDKEAPRLSLAPTVAPDRAGLVLAGRF